MQNLLFQHCVIKVYCVRKTKVQSKVQLQGETVCVVRARVALALARVCVRDMACAHVKIKQKDNISLFITLLSSYVAPMHPMYSYITCVLPYLVVCSRMY